MQKKSTPYRKIIDKFEKILTKLKLKIMKKNGLALLLFTLILVIVSCKKDNSDLPIEYKFVLLDTLGNEKTVFNEGENIIFSFQVINKGLEDQFLENFLPNNDFFRIYQPTTNEETLDYGIPYDVICEIGYFTIPANDTLEINCPWVNSENNNFYFSCLITDTALHETFLPIGNFYTNFEQSFKIADIKTETKHFKINFTIK